MTQTEWDEARRARLAEKYDRVPWLDGSKIKRWSDVLGCVIGGAKGQNFAVSLPDDRPVSVAELKRFLNETHPGIDYDEPGLRVTVERVRFPSLTDEENEEIRDAREMGFGAPNPAFPCTEESARADLAAARDFTRRRMRYCRTCDRITEHLAKAVGGTCVICGK